MYRLLAHKNKDKPCYIDLCCGDGTMMSFIGEKIEKAELVGLDIFEKMLKISKEKLEIKNICHQLKYFRLKENQWKTIYKKIQ